MLARYCMRRGGKEGCIGQLSLCVWCCGGMVAVRMGGEEKEMPRTQTGLRAGHW